MMLLAAASLILIPATIHAAGIEKWSSIVLAQALAQIVATVVGLGYGVNGTSVVAVAEHADGVRYFRVAERARLIAAIPCYTLMVIVMYVVPNPDPLAGILGGAPLAFGAFSGSFFYIGRAAPGWFLAAETLPRVVSMLAGAACLVLGVPLYVGLLIPAVGTVVAIVISNFTIYRSSRGDQRHRPSISSILSQFRAQLAPVASFSLSNGANAVPVFVITGIAPGLVGSFGVFDRLQRQAVVGLSPLTAALQGWVPRRVANGGASRPTMAALGVALIAGAGITVATTAIGPTLITWLAAGQLKPTIGQGLLCGLVIASSMQINLIAYAVLVPLGGIRVVLVGNIVGFLATLASLLFMLSVHSSLSFALGALVIGNFVQLLFQLFMVKLRLKRFDAELVA